MNRREFLKRGSLIPFVGGLSTVAQSEAPESKFRKVKYLRDIKSKGMSQKEVDATNETKAREVANSIYVIKWRPRRIYNISNVKSIKDITQDKLCKVLVDSYEEMGRPINPMAQLRAELKKHNFPREHIKQ